jgi:hypothetical protein
VTPTGAPALSRRISNTENGRRNNGSRPRDGFTIMNCPGRVIRAISGAAKAITL